MIISSVAQLGLRPPSKAMVKLLLNRAQLCRCFHHRYYLRHVIDVLWSILCLKNRVRKEVQNVNSAKLWEVFGKGVKRGSGSVSFAF
jgi:hypothetical protein